MTILYIFAMLFVNLWLKKTIYHVFRLKGQGVSLKQNIWKAHNQFFINTEDSKVIDYLKFLTFLSKEEIEALEAKHNEAPHLREAHKALAKEVISFLHGEEAYNDALKTAEALFNGGNDANMPTSEISEDNLTNDEINIMDLLVLVNLLPSKGEARRLIQQGGLLVNDEKVTNIGLMISKEQLLEGIKIKKGKKVYHKVIIK